MLGIWMLVLMMRDMWLGVIAPQAGKQKADLGIRSAIVFGSAFGSAPHGPAHPGLRPIHRGRSRPGWQNRLFEGQFVPDARTRIPALEIGSSAFCVINLRRGGKIDAACEAQVVAY